MRDVLDSALETFRERGDRVGIEIHREFDCDGAFQGDADVRGDRLNDDSVVVVDLAQPAVVQPLIDEHRAGERRFVLEQVPGGCRVRLRQAKDSGLIGAAGT